jgi:uncharacterized protein (DUF433 family)
MTSEQRMLDALPEEVERMRRIPGIVFADGAAGRRARIAGTAIEVFEVIGAWNAAPGDWDSLRRAFDWLTDEQLQAAVTYYEAYPKEIDCFLQESTEEAIEAFWKQHPFTKPPWR